MKCGPADGINDTWPQVTLDPDHFSWHTLKVGDFNLDGNVDVIAAISRVGKDTAPGESKSASRGWAMVLLAPVQIGSVFGYRGEIGDYDGDGFLDFLLPYDFNSGTILIYRNESQ